jgi:hypothetical protein
MKTSEVNIAVGEASLSLPSTSSLIERLISNFLYTRGQIEKPIDQLRQDCSLPPVQTKLQYADRSTPYQNKGNHLFATPLNPNVPFEHEPLSSQGSEFPVLSDLVSELSLQENVCLQKNGPVSQVESIQG